MKPLIICAALAAFGSTASAQDYTVLVGDTLSNIAAKQLGDGSLWRDICELNRDTVDDCDVITPGVVLKLSAENDIEAEPVAEVVVESSKTVGSPEVAFMGKESFGPGTLPEFTAGKPGIVIERVGDKIKLSGSVTDPSAGGKTQGAFIRLSDEFEMAASGKTIRVTVTLDSDMETTALAAYSTSDVGNSGWREVDASPEGAISTFQYKVPVMKNGNGEYFGILPDPQANGQSVTLTSLMFEILP